MTVFNRALYLCFGSRIQCLGQWGMISDEKTYSRVTDSPVETEISRLMHIDTTILTRVGTSNLR